LTECLGFVTNQFVVTRTFVIRRIIDMPMVTFEATDDEKRVIEKLAKKDHLSISQYVRGCVYMDLLFSGDVDALKVVGKRVKDKTMERLGDVFKRRVLG
jgi:hypothetical protein